MADYALEGPKWGTTGNGTGGGTVTWAVDGTVSASFVQLIVAAFSDWASYANITFQQVASVSTSQIDFNFGYIDGLNSVLAQTNYSYSGSKFNSAAITFDNGEGWHQSGAQEVSNSGVNFFVVALHEIGHAIGLDHYNATPAVMNAYLNSSITDLVASDIHGIQAIYGAAVSSTPSSPAPTSPAPASPAPAVTPVNVANMGYFGQTTHDVKSIAGQIYALYDGLLDHAPDSLGFEYWTGLAKHGTSIQSIASSILNSAEAKAHVGAADNFTFVGQLYQTTLHRQGGTSEINGWVDALNHGASRSDLALSIATSAENLSSVQSAFNSGVFVPDSDAANVARLYHSIFGRAPDASGFKFWTDKASAGTALETIAQTFMDSGEYKGAHAGDTNAKFVDDLYFHALGRHADAQGLKGWTDAIAAGTSQSSIAAGIAESAEAQNHLLPVIEKGWLLS